MTNDDAGIFAPYLARLAHHSTLNGTARRAIEKLPYRLTTARKGVDLVRAGQATDDTYIVTSGFVGGYAQRHDGSRQTTSLYVGGDMIDPASVILGRAGHGLHVLRKSALLRVPRSNLLVAARDHPTFGEALWRACAMQVNMQAKWTDIIGRKSAASKLAHLFCEVAVRCTVGPPFDGTNFDLPLSQQQLSEAIAITAVHLNRVMGRLRQDGLVAMENGVVHVPDWERLVLLGQFDPDYLRSG